MLAALLTEWRAEQFSSNGSPWAMNAARQELLAFSRIPSTVGAPRQWPHTCAHATATRVARPPSDHPNMLLTHRRCRDGTREGKNWKGQFCLVSSSNSLSLSWGRWVMRAVLWAKSPQWDEEGFTGLLMRESHKTLCSRFTCKEESCARNSGVWNVVMT